MSRALFVLIRLLRWHVMLHATTWGWNMNGAVLVWRKMSVRAYANGTVHRQAMLHVIHYPTCISSAYCYKQLIPLPFDWNKYTLASQS